ncbi:MAG: hypothetical protein LKJ13_04735 [Clostridia bacterium]|jgi:hypothetical protein|nr:hypothetical protein [Clostridia bacterium]MCI1999697.1 hypothetical protein [Clostridia bacterium]MCI2013924.1 hypothetical protein [Clostridia bacterium]
MRISNIEILKRDLALQKKKLEDLKTWGSVSILIESQTALVDKLEKQLETIQDNNNSDNPGLDTVVSNL